MTSWKERQIYNLKHDHALLDLKQIQILHHAYTYFFCEQLAS